MLHTVYQYNHQSGTLYLPMRSGPSSPVAIKVRGQLSFFNEAVPKLAHPATDREAGRICPQCIVHFRVGSDATTSTSPVLAAALQGIVL